MICPLCQVEMRITKSRNVVETDDEGNLHLYIDQDLSCMNPKCENYDTVVETIRTELPIG